MQQLSFKLATVTKLEVPLLNFVQHFPLGAYRGLYYLYYTVILYYYNMILLFFYLN